MKVIKILTSALFLVLMISCSSETSKEEKVDEKKMELFLTNMVDVNIIPAFTNFGTELSKLNTSFKTFSTETTKENLAAVKIQYVNTAISWQNTGLYEGGSATRIGPSVTTYLNRFVNVFPTDKQTVDELVGLQEKDASNYSLSSNFKIQGLPALDLLFYDNSVDVLAEFSGENKNKRIDHVNAILSKMIEKNNDVVSGWKTERASFISNTSMAANGSFNKILNAFSEYYEQKIRKAKLGGPLGKFTQGTAYSKDIEALYSKQSKKLLVAAHLAILNFYENGKALSLKTLLKETAVKSKISGKLLSDELSGKLNTVQTKLVAIPNTDFETLVKKKDPSLNQAYTSFVTVVAMIKSEVIPAFEGQINYVDSDGD
ncbi:imelysin family protein [Tenacibaculum finnmarkense]|uniref:imelysin family protein n=1 Tax=Tenacibaculum finnmarkense TaxID=2781243 RepID=UPI001E3B5850|nr:imelysin family protein [Tenacibaculum finnmarkense]MCD8402944.1 imelysin family protein [Tenacibaculum finnmarkense genomovar finnmarkense]